MTAAMKTILLWPDTHLPFEHKRAVANVMKFVNVLQPDEVLFLGDLYDFAPVSRWNRDTILERGDLMQAEADAGDRFFAEFRDAFKGETNLLLGNHCARWKNYLSRYAPGVYGMRDLTIEKMFHFDKYKIQVKDQPYAIAPGVAAIHGDKLGITAGASALKELRRHGRSIVQGHSHRLGVVYHTTDRRRFAAEFGWLGDIRKASYLSFGVADWQLGFGVLTVMAQETVPELIPVQPNGSFCVRGVSYK